MLITCGDFGNHSKVRLIEAVGTVIERVSLVNTASGIAQLVDFVLARVDGFHLDTFAFERDSPVRRQARAGNQVEVAASGCVEGLNDFWQEEGILRKLEFFEQGLAGRREQEQPPNDVLLRKGRDSGRAVEVWRGRRLEERGVEREARLDMGGVEADLPVEDNLAHDFHGSQHYWRRSVFIGC